MKSTFKILTIIILMSFGYFFQANAKNKRSISNLSGVTPELDCRHVGVYEDGSKTLIQRRAFTSEQLNLVDELGERGVYLDLYNAGGFALYKDGSDYTVESVGEGIGLIKNETFRRLPFVAELPIEISFGSKKIVESKLICLRWSNLTIQE